MRRTSDALASIAAVAFLFTSFCPIDALHVTRAPPVRCSAVEERIDTIAEEKYVGAEFETQDTRFFGPMLSPLTWNRIARDKLRALVTDRQSEANFAWHATNSGGRIIFAKRSSLGNGMISVAQHGPWKCMTFDDVEQGIAYYAADDTPRPDVLGFQYLRVMAAAAMASRELALQADDTTQASAEADEAVLCVGLGTGALPGFLAHHFGEAGVRVEVVEIDPLVVDAARTALQCSFTGGSSGLALPAAPAPSSPSTYNVVLADAAAHVQRVLTEQRASRLLGRKRAGLRAIFLDAYNADGETPAHLLRPGFLRDCRDALAPGGVVVANLFNGATGSISRGAVQEFAAALEDAVGPVMSVAVPTQEESLVLIARPGEPMDRPGRQDLTAAARAAWAPVGLGNWAASLVRRPYWLETGGKSSVVAFEDGERGLVEYLPPPTTAGGAPPFDASDTPDELRVGSSAVDWVAGAGPPHGCPDDGCEFY